MNHSLTFSIFLFVISCASINDVRISKGKYDYFQLQEAGPVTGRPIRYKNGQLIFDKSGAQLELGKIQSISELNERVDIKCERSFKLSTHYHQILSYLKQKKIRLAKGELEKTRSLCPSINKISHFYYFEAYIAQLEGDIKKRNQKLESFLVKSESIFPVSFYQEDFVLKEPAEIYLLYKKHARRVLASNIDLKLELTNNAKYNNARYNSYYRTVMPGFKNDSPNRFFFSPAFEWLYGLNISSGYQFKTQYGEFIPIIIVNSHFDLKHIIYRTQVSQSANRRLQTSFVFGLTEWKDVDFDYSALRRAENIKVIDQGFGNFVGYGGTLQFSNTYSLMFQARYVNEKDASLLKGTALFGWAIGEESVLQIGSLNNHPVIAWKTANFYTTLDFKERGINSSVYTGFTF